jgi:hypothetical protein
MPPQPKHTPINLVKHLRRTVEAHKATLAGVAWHAKMEAAKRKAAAEKLQAESGLANPSPVSRETL